MAKNTKTSEATETLFDKLYNSAEEVIKSMRKPLAKNALKRKLTAARDAALDDIDQNTKSSEDEMAKFMDADINKIIEARYNMKKRTEQIDIIQEVYIEMFGTKMPEVEA